MVAVPASQSGGADVNRRTSPCIAHGLAYPTDGEAQAWLARLRRDGRRREKPTGMRQCDTCGHWLLIWPEQ